MKRTVYTTRGIFREIVNIQWRDGIVILKDSGGWFHEIFQNQFIRAEWEED